MKGWGRRKGIIKEGVVREEKRTLGAEARKGSRRGNKEGRSSDQSEQGGDKERKKQGQVACGRQD